MYTTRYIIHIALYQMGTLYNPAQKEQIDPVFTTNIAPSILNFHGLVRIILLTVAEERRLPTAAKPLVICGAFVMDENHHSCLHQFLPIPVLTDVLYREHYTRGGGHRDLLFNKLDAILEITANDPLDFV